MQMQTKRTTSRIPNLHNMSFNLTNHVTKLAHAYPAYLAVSFVERANELSIVIYYASYPSIKVNKIAAQAMQASACAMGNLRADKVTPVCRVLRVK